MLSTPNYLKGVIVLYRSLRQYSKLPFSCACSKNIPEEIIQLLHHEGIKTIQFNETINITNKANSIKGLEHWKYTFDKLLIWGLVEYEKIVFIDSDMMVCGNIDELFNKKDLSAVQAGHFMIKEWVRLNSGCMVLKPSLETKKLLLSSIEQTVLERNSFGYGTGDQDVINYYYKNWPNMEELHLSEEYNVFFMNIPLYVKAGLPKPKIIHFVGSDKPWNKKTL